MPGMDPEGLSMRTRFLLIALSPLLVAAEIHETVYFDGRRAGFQATSSATIDGGKKVRTRSTLELTLKRFGATVKVRREEATTETPEGAILAASMEQGQVGGKMLSLAGTVDGRVLRVRLQPAGTEHRAHWPEGVLGPMRQMEQFATRKPKAGDRFTFRRFEPTYCSVLNVRAEVKDWEMVDVAGKRRKLLRVELAPDRLDDGKTTVTPPRSTWWLDEEYALARRKTTLEGLGELVLVRSDKATATAPVDGGADVGKASLIPLDKPMVRPYESREARYRVVPRGDARVDGLFPSDGHQTLKGNELTVRPRRDARGDGKAAAEFLASCHYIDSDDERIVKLARTATSGESDGWKKALKIERWVRGEMTNDARAELAPASVAARTRRGDCRHHAFLTAAMCRAAGVPSRTAIGLLYVHRGGPVMGFHMWAEVFVDGAWRGIDSTLGKGGVSAAHVKVTDHSWAGVASLTPLLPVQEILGKVRLELIEAK